MATRGGITHKQLSPLYGRIPVGLAYYIMFGTLNEVDANTSTLSREYMYPVLIANPITIDRIGMEIATNGAATAAYRLGMRADDGNGLPGAVVIDSTAQGSAIDATTTGIKNVTITVPVSIGPGIYWVGGVAQTVTSAPRCVHPSYTEMPVRTGSTSAPATSEALSAYYQSGVTGALSTFTPAGRIGISNCPRVFIRSV